MRSHAKASSVGSNSGRPESLGSLRAPGALTALLLALVVAALLVPGAALAAETRLQTGAFGPDGTNATQFEYPGAIAVDQGSHDIYVADYELGKIKKFNENAVPTNFSALGSNELGGFTLFAGEQLQQLAVDSASHDFYVAEFAGGVIKAFHQDGTPANFSAGPGAGTNELAGGVCGVAVDSNGAIYMGDYRGGSNGGVHIFKANGEPLASFPVEEEGCNVAVDGNGVIYVSHYPFFGEGRVEKFTPSEFPVTASTTYEGEMLDSSPAFGVTVDPSTDDVYVDHGDHISVYESSGAFKYEFGALTSSEGIAVDGGTEKAYATDGGAKQVKVFGPPVPLPTATTEDASAIATTTTTLNGTVNPNGKQLTDCHFEYIADASYHAKEVQELTVSATGGTFTLKFEAQSTPALPFNASASEVEAKLNALASIRGHFGGFPESTDGSVTVSGGPGNEAGSSPYTITFNGALAYKDVAQLTANAASLTGGSASAVLTTTQQGKPDSYAGATGVPCVPAAGSIPPDSNPHAVSAAISGLSPNTTYHFRLLAASAEGGSEGSDRTLTTAIAAPLIGEQSAESGTAGATLSAEINPKGSPTTYHVEYGPTAAYDQSTAESSPIGSAGDDADHSVSVHIGGLTPGTAYHFRFVATSSAGTGEGTDATFATFSTPPAFGPCPNDQLRSGAGALLPDCRAYEQASPTDKHGSNAIGAIGSVEASSSGDRVTFLTLGGLPTSGGSSDLAPFLASRGPGGWSTDGLLLPTEPGGSVESIGWNEDLSRTLANAPAPGNPGPAAYLRSSNTGAFQLIVTGGRAEALAGSAADPDHLIFESEWNLAPGVPSFKNQVYDFDHGALSVASRIPAGSATSCDDEGGPACVFAPSGAAAGPYGWLTGGQGGAHSLYDTRNTISRDGSKVFFTAEDTKQLYVREDGTATTQVSASHASVPDPNGHKPAAFVAATPDGSKVFFLSCEKLTDDSTAFSNAENSCTKFLNQGQDLYSYDTSSGELTDLSVDSNLGDPQGAQVQGVLGTSADGSYVYFVANGVLAPGASLGECEGFNSFTNAECNLYVSHDGAVKLVARLQNADFTDWMGVKSHSVGAEQKESRVSADGTSVLFGSRKSLTGYDNRLTPTALKGCEGGDPQKSEACRELFRYNTPSEELACVSCNPSGARPIVKARLGDTGAGIKIGAGGRFNFLTRNLSADGSRAFFDSQDALVPTDTNGVTDVYEWEAKGSGSCETESQNGGCLYLISSGASPDPSYLGDASASGDHVFFFSSQQLVPGDLDHLYDAYDATVDGGLASQHSLAPPTCSGVACQANPAPPPDPPASSAVFQGPGNAHKPPKARKCPKGKRKVRRAGKVSCQKASKQHKRHNNRGGSK